MTQEMFQEIMQQVDIHVEYFIGNRPKIKKSWHYKPYLYFLERDGIIFYIGQSNHIQTRFFIHRKNKIFDSYYILHCPVKTVRFIRYNPHRRKNEHEYYLLTTLLENYFINIFRTTQYEDGNKVVLNFNLIRFMKIYDGVHKLTNDRRMDWRRNYKIDPAI